MPEHPLLYVNLKADWANKRLKQLHAVRKRWMNSKAHTVREYDDFEHGVHVFQFEVARAPNCLPLLIGDFVSCLRSSLDQLAWSVANLPCNQALPFDERAARKISFPICKQDCRKYRDLLELFPSTATKIIDDLQPYKRERTPEEHPLWQLNELWNIDKHKIIPVNSVAFEPSFSIPKTEWESFIEILGDGLKVNFPTAFFNERDVYLKPEIAMQIVLGREMDPSFEVWFDRLTEINDFVRNDVIPKFMGLFS